MNGVTIPRDEIAREVQHHKASRPFEAWQSAARALVIRELLLQRARSLGIASAPRENDGGRRETEEEALMRALIEKEVATPDPDEAACRRYFEQNRRRFRSQPIYAASHILFAALRDQTDSFARAQSLANSVLAELKRHPERFGELARAHSACPSAAQSGSLGQITCGQTTIEFERALERLVPGAMTDALVETRYGLHIIRLDGKIDGEALPFELVAERIAAYLRESVMHRATAQYIARLASAAEIAGIEIAGAEAHRVS
ncbi:peptidylprolyl isomerase [Methyloceanibacter superfactus]|uniref:peptidylprolyl isomerase n=1 Tax=Methyloceanibacter superfactus TaxID=1774969 RepID=UPI001FCCD177|nr:peptidylprolyl isomerase [Methyloceanibacter superfactus]